MTLFANNDAYTRAGSGDFQDWVNDIVGTSLLEGGPEKIELVVRSAASATAPVEAEVLALGDLRRKRRY